MSLDVELTLLGSINEGLPLFHSESEILGWVLGVSNLNTKDSSIACCDVLNLNTQRAVSLARSTLSPSHYFTFLNGLLWRACWKSSPIILERQGS